LDAFSPKHLKLLTERRIRTNMHYILDDVTLPEALEIVDGKHDELLNGLSGIVFLTRKPQGRSNIDGLLSFDTPLLQRFLNTVASGKSQIPLGFDACAVPLLLHHGGIDARTIDACECGFFSVYVDEDLEVRPCSFANKGVFGFDLHKYTFETIWEEKFADYRKQQTALVCSRECVGKAHCRGRCPLFSEIGFCFQPA